MMKIPLKTLLPVLTISAGLITQAVAFDYRRAEPLDAQATDAAVTLLTSRILEDSQFAHLQLNDELADKFLDRYLDTLDPGHMIFEQSDLDEFARFRASLAEATREVGDSRPAQIIFKRFLERLDQRSEFVNSLLETETFDFTTDEEFCYDREEAPHPANRTAAEALWRQQLRSEYLQEKLAGKQRAEIVKTLGRRSARSADMMRKLDDQAVLELYLEALAQTYDPHSDYMGAETLKSFEIAMNLSLTGIGATLQSEDGYCKIRELVPGGPADRSGLIHNGDRIVGAAQAKGEEYTDLVDLPLNQVVELVRGKKGTPVYLNLIPADAADESVRKQITIVREEIKLEDQQAKASIMDVPTGDQTQRIGVIDLPAFYAGEGNEKSGPTSASADVERLIHKLKQEGITGLILDLRRNGGGSLQEAIDLTGLFISTGPVVQTRDLQGRLTVGHDQDSKIAWDGPLLVLTSRMSASASEIVAGALQDYDRAIVVGDSATFGKGTVQTVYPLDRIMQRQGLIPDSDPGALKVTISKFYRPSGQSTQLEGVKSDIIIPSLTDLPEIGEADLGNALPWETIPAQRYREGNLVDPVLAPLRKASSQRISNDPDFVQLARDVERFHEMREDKTISLNEQVRKKEMDEIKALNKAAKEERLTRNIMPPTTYEITLQNLAQAGPGKLVKAKLPQKDSENEGGFDAAAVDALILREAQNILIDYGRLLDRQPVISQR